MLQARLHAKEQRDFDRSRRSDSPDVTLKVASVVLNLSHLPMPSSAYYARQLLDLSIFSSGAIELRAPSQNRSVCEWALL